MNAALDNELIALLADEYEIEVIGCLPDLQAEDDSFDAVVDFAAQRIHDGETLAHRGAPQPEHRAAARALAVRICGEGEAR